MGDGCLDIHLTGLFALCLKCFIIQGGSAARSPLRQMTQGQAPSEAYEPRGALTICGTFTCLKRQVMLIWLSTAFVSSR